MQVYEVIPVARNRAAPETLSYFSTKKNARGDLVKTNFRGREIFAVIKNASELSGRKAELKRGTFRLKPLKSLWLQNFLPEDFFEILRRLSREFLLPEGLILSRLLPKPIFSKKVKIPLPSQKSPKRIHQKSAFRGSAEERLRHYRGLIREHLARKKSLMLLSPRIETLKLLAAELGRGIEDYSFIFHSEIPAGKYLGSWNRALTLPHPVLILGTGQVLSLDRPDLETLIIDEEGSRLWREWEGTPFDFREAARIIAEAKGLKLIFADEILRLETFWQSEAGLLEALAPLLTRIQSPVETKLLEIGPAQDGFSWLSKELRAELEESIFKNEKILLFANRKGYGSFTLCQDCNRALLCPACSVPLVLHGLKREERKFFCHHCLGSLTVPERCPHCLSWKLKEFGLGVEKIQEEFQKLFPKSENALFATESVLYHPELAFDLTAIVSLDHLFSIPDFRINERIFRLISELKARTRRKLILQTRISENKLFQDALAGSISGFYQGEIKGRENFRYPPFVKLVKLTKEDKNYAALKKNQEEALGLLKDCKPLSFPAFLERIKKRYRWNIVLKIPPGGWPPEEKLENLLKNLALAGWELIVDPESII